MLEFLKALFWSYTFPVIHLWASWCCYIWYCCLCWWYCSLLCDLIKCVETSDLWQQLELASELESDLPDTLEWGRKWLNDFNVGKTQLVWFDRSNKTGATNVKVDGPGLAEKSFLKMVGLAFSSKLDWGSYIIFVAKTTSKEKGALILSMKFLSPEDVPCISINLCSTVFYYKCMEYCRHVWAGVPSCYVEFLDKLQKRICRYVGLLVLHFQPFLNPWLIVEMKPP